jgi:hypothetical protein
VWTRNNHQAFTKVSRAAIIPCLSRRQQQRIMEIMPETRQPSNFTLLRKTQAIQSRFPCHYQILNPARASSDKYKEDITPLVQNDLGTVLPLYSPPKLDPNDQAGKSRAKSENSKQVEEREATTHGTRFWCLRNDLLRRRGKSTAPTTCADTKS